MFIGFFLLIYCFFFRTRLLKNKNYRRGYKKQFRLDQAAHILGGVSTLTRVLVRLR